MKIKIILGVLVLFFVLLAAAVLIIGAHLGDLVKAGLQVAGPKVTQTSLTVEKVEVSLLGGSAGVNGLVLGNPEGYQAPQSISVSNASVSLVAGSVLSDKIVIRSVEVHGLVVTFEGNPFGANNLTKIMANVQGPNAASGPASSQPAINNPAPAPAPSSPAKPAKKLEVDSLVIAGAEIHAHLPGIVNRQLTLPLPEIRLTGLGQGPDGITGAELTRQVLGEITAGTIKSLAAYLGNFGKNVTDAAKSAALEGLKNAGGITGQGADKLKQGLNGLLGK